MEQIDFYRKKLKTVRYYLESMQSYVYAIKINYCVFPNAPKLQSFYI